MSQRTDLPELTCEVCHHESAVGVAAVPGVPISVAYGRECLNANAHPYTIVVANTAMVGGYEHAADWWQQMVDDTLAHLGYERDRFDNDVQVAAAAQEASERAAEERWAAEQVEGAEEHLRSRGVLPPQP